MSKFIIIFSVIISYYTFSQDWYKQISEEANCSVEFPDKPSSIEITDQTDYKKIIKYFYSLNRRNTDYTLNIYFLKSEPQDIKTFLSDKINKILKDFNGIKKDLLELYIDNVFGYEMDIELNNEFGMRVRVFYYEKKFYELIVRMPTERINTSDINNFMNSFKINVK